MSRDVMDHIGAIYARLSELEGRHERAIRPGTVKDRDYSDPTKPRARIVVGVDADGGDVLGPWMPISTHAGDRNVWHPVTLDQQMLQVAPDGDHDQAHLVPLGHSGTIPAPDTDPDTHVEAFGRTKRTLKKDSLTHTVGGTQVHQTASDHKVTAPGKVEIAAGDPSAANSSGFGGSLLAPHELNRVLQSVVARLDQHDHHITALHGEASTMVDKLVGLCPALMDQKQLTLNHKPDGLKAAADKVQGVLPDFASSAIQQTLGKLLNSPLGVVVDLVQGDVAGQMGGLLGQIGSLVGGAGLSGGAAATAQMHLGQAGAAIAAAAAGGSFELDRALSSLTSLAQGSPVEAMLGDAVGQLRAQMGSTAGLMAGLSGLVNGQTNASRGRIKSALFGGYGS